LCFYCINITSSRARADIKHSERAINDCRHCYHVANGSEYNKVLRVSYTAPGEW